jgi:site-specific DNA-methyltransferase (adenine-specific)
MTNTLYYGDNLDVLRHEIAGDSVDLIYLDPPFNSQANYNVLFKSPSGKAADAQIEAFEDTWHWGEEPSAPLPRFSHRPRRKPPNCYARCARFSAKTT